VRHSKGDGRRGTQPGCDPELHENSEFVVENEGQMADNPSTVAEVPRTPGAEFEWRDNETSEFPKASAETFQCSHSDQNSLNIRGSFS
jgi:hypothetical protein